MDTIATLCAAAVACSMVVQSTPHTRPMPVTAPRPFNHMAVLPPLEFDKPYGGTTLIVTASSKEHLRLLCNQTEEQNKLGLACALLNKTTNVCRIILAPEAEIIDAGYTLKLTIRHERGHCHGWSGKHEGSRMATKEDF